LWQPVKALFAKHGFGVVDASLVEHQGGKRTLDGSKDNLKGRVRDV